MEPNLNKKLNLALKHTSVHPGFARGYDMLLYDVDTGACVPIKDYTVTCEAPGTPMVTASFPCGMDLSWPNPWQRPAKPEEPSDPKVSIEGGERLVIIGGE